MDRGQRRGSAEKKKEEREGEDESGFRKHKSELMNVITGSEHTSHNQTPDGGISYRYVSAAHANSSTDSEEAARFVNIRRRTAQYVQIQ